MFLVFLAMTLAMTTPLYIVTCVIRSLFPCRDPSVATHSHFTSFASLHLNQMVKFLCLPPPSPPLLLPRSPSSCSFFLLLLLLLPLLILVKTSSILSLVYSSSSILSLVLSVNFFFLFFNTKFSDFRMQSPGHFKNGVKHTCFTSDIHLFSTNPDFFLFIVF